MLAHLGPTVCGYDVEVIEREYLDVVNERLKDAGLSVDENSDVHADGFIDGFVHELLDDAFFRVDLAHISEKHKLGQA